MAGQEKWAVLQGYVEEYINSNGEDKDVFLRLRRQVRDDRDSRSKEWVDHIRNSFQRMMADDLRPGIVCFGTELLRLYVILGVSTEQCRFVLNTMTRTSEGEEFDLAKLPRSQSVALAYYWGCYLVTENNLEDADTKFLWAFTNSISYLNRKAILQQQIPGRLCMGKFPTSRMLEHFNLRWFAPIVGSLYRGDAQGLCNYLTKYRIFISARTNFLTLLKMQPVAHRKAVLVAIAHRNLAAYRRGFCGSPEDDEAVGEVPEKLTYCFAAQIATAAVGHNPQCPLEPLLKCFNLPEDEAISVLCYLIHIKAIRGYVSWEKKKLVVAKQNPFPAQF